MSQTMPPGAEAEKRLGLNRRQQMPENNYASSVHEQLKPIKHKQPYVPSKRLYNVGDFSPYNLIWESTLPKATRDRYMQMSHQKRGSNPPSANRQ